MGSDYINYSALNIGTKNQFGSNTKTNSQNSITDFDYTDGLTKEELEKIDTNKDGAITEAEFKKAFGGTNNNSYKEYWNTYKEFYNATTNKNATKSVQENNGIKITSYFDNNGAMTHYYETIQTETGTEIKVKYEMVDGQPVKKNVKKTYADGTSELKDEKTNDITKTNVDGTQIKKTNNGKIKKVTSEKTGTNYEFSYKSDGTISSAKINGKNYANCEVSGNNIVVKDKNGNTILKIYTDSSNNTIINEYNSNNKKAKSTKINSYGEAVDIVAYDENGKLASRHYCEYEDYQRNYTYGANGKLSSSTDYSKGVLYSSQTYSETTGKDIYGEKNTTGKLLASRTYYDKDGNITSYKTFSYEKSGENAIRTTTTYEADKTTEAKTTKTTMDEFGNKLSVVTYKDGAEVSKTTYEYSEKNPQHKMNDFALVSKTTETNTKETKSEYSEGVITNKTTTEIVNGKAKNTEYNYSYYTNGQVSKKEQKDNKTGNKTITTYDEDGNTTSVTERNYKGELTSYKMPLDAILATQYPNLTSKQLNTLIKKCKQLNNIDSNTLIAMDLNTNNFDITIPEFEKDANGNLVFK